MQQNRTDSVFISPTIKRLQFKKVRSKTKNGGKKVVKQHCVSIRIHWKYDSRFCDRPKIPMHNPTFLMPTLMETFYRFASAIWTYQHSNSFPVVSIADFLIAPIKKKEKKKHSPVINYDLIKGLSDVMRVVDELSTSAACPRRQIWLFVFCSRTRRPAECFFLRRINIYGHF